MSTNNDVHDTKQYRYDSSKTPGRPDVGGLDELSLKLPVTDRDAQEQVGMTLLLVVLDEAQAAELEASHEVGDENWTVTVTDRDRVPMQKLESVHADIIWSIVEDYEAHLDSLYSEVELDQGQAVAMADIEATFKNIEGWTLARWTADVYEESGVILDE